MRVLIVNGVFISRSSSFSGYLVSENGTVKEFGPGMPDGKNEYDETIDASGYVVLPSFIDLHSHFRDPGQTYKEDILSGSHAAAKGGYTCVNLMANTSPVCSDMKTVEYVRNKADDVGLVDVFQTVSITKNFDGKDLSHLESIDPKIVRIISDDGFGVDEDEIMREALRMSQRKGWVISVHEEFSDHSINSRESENKMTLRDINLNEDIGAELHIAHVSTRQAMEYIIAAKERGVKITCEVTPHHLTMTEKIPYSLHPPFRTAEDVEFLKKALKMGFIDAIATDHAPHSLQDKLKGARGISGIETAFSVCYTSLVKTGILSLKELSERMSARPAEILNVKKGDIVRGYDADFVFISENSSFEVDTEEFESKGKNSPFAGMQLFGIIELVLKRGREVYRRKK